MKFEAKLSLINDFVDKVKTLPIDDILIEYSRQSDLSPNDHELFWQRLSSVNHPNFICQKPKSMTWRDFYATVVIPPKLNSDDNLTIIEAQLRKELSRRAGLKIMDPAKGYVRNDLPFEYPDKKIYICRSIEEAVLKIFDDEPEVGHDIIKGLFKCEVESKAPDEFSKYVVHVPKTMFIGELTDVYIKEMAIGLQIEEMAIRW